MIFCFYKKAMRADISKPMLTGCNITRLLHSFPFRAKSDKLGMKLRFMIATSVFETLRNLF